jgi:threonine/homoserine/homoserine lactone efflux protein
MQAEVLGAVVKGILIGLFMAISVGPTLFAVIKYSMDNSYKAGLAFVLGVSASDIMYVTIANIAASWLVLLKEYTNYIAYGGAAILIAVGAAGVFRKATPKRPAKNQVTISGAHYVRIWASGFLINTINPGVIISWLAAVSATANQNGTYRFILFATCLVLILAIDFLKVFLAEKIRVLLTPRRLIYVQRGSSFVLMCLGLLLLVKTILE